MPPKRNKNKRIADSVDEEDGVISRAQNSGSLDKILAELASGITGLQRAVDNLTIRNERVHEDIICMEDPININPNIVYSVDRSYISNFKELGGGNILFFPCGKLHPKAFLRKIKKTFDDAGVPEQYKLGLVLPCLKDTAADWAAIKESTFANFDDFEDAFINRFWGVEKQQDLFLKLSYGKYQLGSRSEYFLDLFNHASFLSTPIPNQKLILLLSRHFPPDIQRGIITLGLKTFDEVDEYLRNIDATYTQGTITATSRESTNEGLRSQGAYSREGHGAANWRRQQGRYEDNNMRHIQTTRFNDDLDFSSESETEGEILLSKPLSKSPIINAKIADMNVGILIDSGSEITVISEIFYNVISKRVNIPILPVTNLAIKVAIGGKQQRIKAQVLVPVEIPMAKIRFDVKCFVAPGLNCDILFGFDWLTDYKANVDFDKATLLFSCENKEYIVYYNQNEDIGNMVDFSVCKNVISVSPNPVNATKHKYTDQEIEAVIGKAHIDENGKKKLLDVVHSYREIFSECPGRVKSYVHMIDMIDEAPFQCVNYPVPFMYRNEVRSQINEMVRMGYYFQAKNELYLAFSDCKKKRRIDTHLLGRAKIK